MGSTQSTEDQITTALKEDDKKKLFQCSSCSPVQVDPTGRLLLIHRAASVGAASIIEHLLTSHPILTLPSDESRSKVKLWRHANVQTLDDQENTPLHCVLNMRAKASPKFLNTVSKLLQRHANPNVLNREGKTPIDLAKESAVKAKKQRMDKYTQLKKEGANKAVLDEVLNNETIMEKVLKLLEDAAVRYDENKKHILTLCEVFSHVSYPSAESRYDLASEALTPEITLHFEHLVNELVDPEKISKDIIFGASERVSPKHSSSSPFSPVVSTSITNQTRPLVFLIAKSFSAEHAILLTKQIAKNGIRLNKWEVEDWSRYGGMTPLHFICKEHVIRHKSIDFLKYFVQTFVPTLERDSILAKGAKVGNRLLNVPMILIQNDAEDAERDRFLMYRDLLVAEKYSSDAELEERERAENLQNEMMMIEGLAFLLNNPGYRWPKLHLTPHSDHWGTIEETLLGRAVRADRSYVVKFLLSEGEKLKSCSSSEDSVLYSMRKRILKTDPFFDFEYHDKVTVNGMLKHLVCKENLLEGTITRLCESFRFLKIWTDFREEKTLMKKDASSAAAVARTKNKHEVEFEEFSTSYKKRNYRKTKLLVERQEMICDLLLATNRLDHTHLIPCYQTILANGMLSDFIKSKREALKEKIEGRLNLLGYFRNEKTGEWELSEAEREILRREKDKEIRKHYKRRPRYFSGADYYRLASTIDDHDDDDDDYVERALRDRRCEVDRDKILIHTNPKRKPGCEDAVPPALLPEKIELEKKDVDSSLIRAVEKAAKLRKEAEEAERRKKKEMEEFLSGVADVEHQRRSDETNSAIHLPSQTPFGFRGDGDRDISL